MTINFFLLHRKQYFGVKKTGHYGWHGYYCRSKGVRAAKTWTRCFFYRYHRQMRLRVLEDNNDVQKFPFDRNCASVWCNRLQDETATNL